MGSWGRAGGAGGAPKVPRLRLAAPPPLPPPPPAGPRARSPPPRPLTATLERPRLLNAALAAAVDMSLTRTALFRAAGFCVVTTTLPVTGNVATGVAGTRRIVRGRPALHALRRRDARRARISSPAPAPPPAPTPATTPWRWPAPAQRPVPPVIRSPEVGRAPRGTGRGPAPLGVGLTAGLSEGPAAVLAPCTACGRPEQPERLHSHPPPPSAAAAAASAVRGPGRTRSPRAGGAVTSMAAAGAGAGDAPKSSVRKPVALKYRSGGGGGGGASPRGGRATAHGAAAAAAAANGSAGVSGVASPEAATSAPTQTTAQATTMEATQERGASGRTAARGFLLCYLCGRAFGRASLPLHEPHCLQRWQRENDALPPSLRRPPPERPAAPAAALSTDQWNRMAWEASQLRLVPCSRCGRTFAPDRLPVHERSCRAPPVANAAAASTVASTTIIVPATTAASSEQRGSGDDDATCAAVSRPPGSVPCEWCGRLFGSASIAIHAPQCTARPAPGAAAAETTPSLVPAATIAAVAVASTPASPGATRGGKHGRGRGGSVGARGERGVGSERAASAMAAAAMATSTMVAVGAGGAGGTWAARRPSLCYLCGRPFGRASIAIHERACRERWRRENERLPPHLRRQEPEKPCVVYRADGSMDMAGTMEAIWQSHLEQLVPCVHCGRTFYPDRLEVHQRACKGPRR